MSFTEWKRGSNAKIWAIFYQPQPMKQLKYVRYRETDFIFAI